MPRFARFGEKRAGRRKKKNGKSDFGCPLCSPHFHLRSVEIRNQPESPNLKVNIMTRKNRKNGLFSFFSNLSTRRRNRRRKALTARQMKLERMETRELFAAGVGDVIKPYGDGVTLIENGAVDVLRVQGTHGSDDITVDWLEGRNGKTDKDWVTISGKRNGNDFSVNVRKKNFGKISLYGYNGNDQLHNKTNIASYINGGRGNDVLTGGDGRDALYGNYGKDILKGGKGNDTLRGGSDNDRLYGGAGDDDLNGGSGSDWMQGGSGSDKINGSKGSDTVSYEDESRGVKVDLVKRYAKDRNESRSWRDSIANTESIVGSRHDDDLRGNDLNNIIKGRGGNDHLYGRGGNDKLYGEAGDDTLKGGLGSDKLDGGGDHDNFTADLYDKAKINHGDHVTTPAGTIEFLTDGSSYEMAVNELMINLGQIADSNPHATTTAGTVDIVLNLVGSQPTRNSNSTSITGTIHLNTDDSAHVTSDGLATNINPHLNAGHHSSSGPGTLTLNI